MAYTQLPTRTASDTNSAGDVNQLQTNIEALKGGTGATAPTTTIEALATAKAERASSPTAGHMANLDADGDLVDSGKVGANVVTAAAALTADRLVAGDGTTLAKTTTIDPANVVTTTATLTSGNIMKGGGTKTADVSTVTSTVLEAAMAAWTSYNPTITSASGTITTVGTVTAYYVVIGKTVHLSVNVTITTAGTAGGDMIITLPSGKDCVRAGHVGSGRENNNTGAELQCRVIAGELSKFRAIKYDNNTAFGNNANYLCMITYEIA